jgi:hypothetical protein
MVQNSLPVHFFCLVCAQTGKNYNSGRNHAHVNDEKITMLISQNFSKISGLKITHLEIMLTNIFFNIFHFNSGLAFKSKNYYITSQNWVYFIRKNFQKLSQKRKLAL